MIIVVSSSPREANALTAIASKPPQPVCACHSVANFRGRLRTIVPSVVVTRARLNDGYSDDVMALLANGEVLGGTKVIVLAGADCTSAQEARQLSLGADCVMRDPLRAEVLREYIMKFTRNPVAIAGRGIEPRSFALAGANIQPDQQRASYQDRSAHISPKEIELARFLAESTGKVLSYDLLYSELFGRVFSGDSANMRVLFGKLVSTFRKLGIDLRATVRVTPKSGYTYLGALDSSATAPLKIKKPRPKSRL